GLFLPEGFKIILSFHLRSNFMDSVFEILAISCGGVMFFGAFLAFFAFLRYLRYREILTLAEKGLVHPRVAENGKGTLFWGIAITGFGIALCMGLYPIGWLSTPGRFPLNFGPWMLAGLIPTFFGLSLVVIYLIMHREEKMETKPHQTSVSSIPEVTPDEPVDPS
ncbi:MAG: hypothetical protein L0209_09415, partial [candidate division Zixibacteria bacterium]|nr:hypothetical protein [candidate division Zixibacteria bacterium]